MAEPRKWRTTLNFKCQGQCWLTYITGQIPIQSKNLEPFLHYGSNSIYVTRRSRYLIIRDYSFIPPFQSLEQSVREVIGEAISHRFVSKHEHKRQKNISLQLFTQPFDSKVKHLIMQRKTSNTHNIWLKHEQGSTRMAEKNLQDGLIAETSLAWKLPDTKLLTEGITKMIAVLGQRIIWISSPGSDKFSQNLIYLGLGAVCFS